MAQVSSSGVASGLDVNSIVSQLVAVERRPIDTAQQRQLAIGAKLSAFTTLEATFTSLKSALTSLQSFSSFQSKLASSSDSSSVTATVNDPLSAVIGSSTVSQVIQLAQTQKLASSPFAYPTALVGTGTIKIKVGSGTETSIAIDSSHATLTQIRDKINAANAGVTASILKTGDKQYKLVLQSSQSGTENSLQVDITDDDSNNLDTNGLSQLRYTPSFSSPDNVTNLTEIQSGRDAQFILDGTTLTRGSNTVTDAMDGVTITLLKKTATDAEISINVTPNIAAVKGDIETFVSAYNEVMKGLNSAQTFDATNRKGGPLFGNTTAQAITRAFRLLLKGSVPDLDGNFSSLPDIGITSQPGGTLTIDAAKLNAALGKDPLAVGRVFALFDKTVDSTVVTPTSGIADQLFKAITDMLDRQTGSLSSAEKGLRNSSTGIDKEVARLGKHVSEFEKRTREKFSRLETQLSHIQGVGSALNSQITQLDNLTSFISRRNNTSSNTSSG